MKLDARLTLFLYLVGVFLTCLLIGNLIGGKLTEVQVFGERVISVGNLAFPLTFILTDILNEFYGRRTVRAVTMLGFFMTALAFGLIYLAGSLVFSDKTAISPAAFENVFTSASRIQIASMVAYLTSQFLDIGVFFLIKRITADKMLWLRATGSTAISQLVDTILVTNIAFWSMPGAVKWNMIETSYAVKLLAAIALTPVLYGLHELIERRFGIRPVPAEVKAGEIAS